MAHTHTLSFFLPFFGAHLILLLLHRPCGGGSGSSYMAKIQLGIPFPPMFHGLCIIGSRSFVFFLLGARLMFEIRSTFFVRFFLSFVNMAPIVALFPIGVIGRWVYIYIYEGKGCVFLCVCIYIYVRGKALWP